MDSKTVILNLRGTKFEVLRETFKEFDLEKFDCSKAYGICNCTSRFVQVDCPHGHFQKLEDHKKTCDKKDHYDVHPDCNWKG